MLTKRQKQILDFIKEYMSKHGYSPSLEEIAENFNLSSLSTVHYHLTKLEAEGAISRYDYLPRSIQVEAQTNSSLVQIPLVGVIAAGEPIEAIEDPEVISVPKSIISDSGIHYALKVKGNSMIDEGIFDGDIVIVRKQDIVENGEIGVALINGNEATLKKIYREHDRFRLQPANPHLKPIYAKKILIQGKVTGILRAIEKETISFKKLNLFSNEIEEQYSKKTPYNYRKQLGQFFTPFIIAEIMSSWVLKIKPKTILDPACGTCVFERSVYKQSSYPIQVEAYDIDSKVIEICEKIAPSLGTLKIDLFREDFLLSSWNKKYDAIICNPPYLKHHYVKDKNKYIALFRRHTKRPFSLNTNVYSLFIIKALSQLAPNGRMAFITPSEFLNANYGIEVKRYLLQSKKWRFLIVFDFKMSVFNNATTTACITLFENIPASKTDKLIFIKVKNEEGIHELVKILNKEMVDNLSTQSIEVFSKSLNELDPKIKWKQYFEKQYQSSLLVPFTKYAKVMRGIATGANSYFTFSENELEKFKINKKYVIPCLTKANYAPLNIFTNDDFRELTKQGKKVYLLYINGKKIDKNLEKYLRLGEKKKIHERYLTSHRSPWWLTEERRPAPILVTVFGRKGLRFVRNEAGVVTLTCFHSIYPTKIGEKYIDVFMAFLITDTAQVILGAEKREYGNGLEKFEPNDLNNGLVVDFEKLPSKTILKIKNNYAKWRKNILERNIQEAETIKKEIDNIFRELLLQFKGRPRKIFYSQLSLKFF